MKVEVFITNLKNKSIEDIFNDYKEYIKEKDIEKMDRFKLDLNKKQSIMSSILKNKYIEGDIYYNEHGKPLSDSIFFNVSHSDDFVLLARCEKEIGVDVEHVVKEIDDDLIDYVCNRGEVSYMNQSDKNKAFYTIWTKKEAVLKLEGIGLTNKLKDLLVDNKYYLNTKYISDYVYSIAINCDKNEVIEIKEVNEYE